MKNLTLVLLTLTVLPLNAENLWQQDQEFIGRFTPDQNFELKDFLNYNSVAADDFYIENGGWIIESIEIFQASTGIPNSVNIAFYEDFDGYPKEEAICEYSHIAAQITDNIIRVNLPTNCSLNHPGRYWVSHSANQTWAQGQHFWKLAMTQNGFAAVWKNPRNGYNSNCTEWTRINLCAVGGNHHFDQMFNLYGNKIQNIEAIPIPRYTNVLLFIFLILTIHFKFSHLLRIPNK